MLSSLKKIQCVLEKLKFEIFQLLSSYRMSTSPTGWIGNRPSLNSTLWALSRPTAQGSQRKQTAQLQSQAQPLTPMTLPKQVSLAFVVSSNEGNDNKGAIRGLETLKRYSP